MSPSRLSALAAGAALGVLLLYVIAVLAPYAAERKDFGFALSRVDGRIRQPDLTVRGLPSARPVTWPRSS